MADDLDAELTELVVQSPANQQRLVGLVRTTCATALQLTPVPAEVMVTRPERDTCSVWSRDSEAVDAPPESTSGRMPAKTLSTSSGPGSRVR